MSLLAPLFLLGIAAVAIPLLVHLVHRERRDPTAFPSLMFLERTPAPFSARRHLRDPWLFALRALAVLALALAFARPVWAPRPGATGTDPRRRELVVLLDRSFSMRIGDRWSRARAAVDSVIRTLAPGDRLTLVPFDRRAQVVTAATGDAAQLRAAVDSLRPGDESTRLAPAFAIAQQRLAASDAPWKVIVLVSDLQRSGWDLSDDSRLPKGITLSTLNVADDTLPVDRAVRAVEVRPARGPGAPQMIVTARLAQVGAPIRGVAVRLEVGGRVVEERTVDLPRDGSASVTFAALPVPPNAVPARVVMAADALPGDDAFHFLLSQAPTLPVLLLDGRSSPYLARALSIGDAPAFVVTSRSPARVTPADLVNQRVVVLADGAFPTALGAQRLVQFVENGGGLIVAMGSQMTPRSWPVAAGTLRPGSIPPVTTRPGATGAVLSAFDQNHPALSLLSSVRQSDLSAARFYSYRSIDTTAGVLARFDDGTAALTEHAVGRGRVLTFGSAFDGVWNDLPRQPTFLPLVQQLTRYAAGWRDDPRAFVIGTAVRPADLAAGERPEVTRWVATAPSGARTTVGGNGAPLSLELTEAGMHELRPGGSPGARPLLVAANIAPSELDFAPFDPLRLSSALLGGAGSPGGAQIAVEPESSTDREARQSTWWYLLFGATLLLIAESVVARRSSTRPPVVE